MILGNFAIAAQAFQRSASFFGNTLQNIGGGLFVQYRQRLAEALESGAFTTWIPGPHLEALARVGNSKMDFRTDSSHPSTFEVNRIYYGASLGGGYVFEPAPQFAVDLYGHGSWVSLAKKNANSGLGYAVHFERADSLRLVSGLRAAYKANQEMRPYVGLALDWEVLGRPEVRIDGYQADRADLSGLSGLLELGIGRKMSDRVFIDARAAGSVGQRRGIGGMLEIRYAF